jgi:hypothetical protein
MPFRKTPPVEPGKSTPRNSRARRRSVEAIVLAAYRKFARDPLTRQAVQMSFGHGGK